MEFPREGKIPCDIVDRNRGSHYHRPRHEKLHRKDERCLVSARNMREFARNDRVINNLRTCLSPSLPRTRVTSSISAPPSEAENIFFPPTPPRTPFPPAIAYPRHERSKSQTSHPRVLPIYSTSRFFRQPPASLL